MTTRPPKHGGHARRRWQARAQPQAGTNVVDLNHVREVKNSYWIGWADCYQQIQDAQGGAL